jgi:hypothetical protein
MTICYCERCGALMSAKVPEPKLLCADCKAGKKPKYRGPRDCALIPRKKLDALRANEASKRSEK